MKITCHMIMSADGRLLPSYWTSPMDSSKTVEGVYEEVAKRFPCDAWAVGRVTMAEYAPEIITQHEPMRGPKSLQTSTFMGNREGRPLAVVFDPTGKLQYTSSTLPGGEHIVTVLGSHVTRAYQKKLEDAGVSYIMRTPGSRLEETISALRHLENDFGVKNLLLEGGAYMNGSFFSMGLVDELSLIVYPGIDGWHSNPGVIGCHEGAIDGIQRRNKLELVDCEKLGAGYVWLHYLVHRP